MEGHDSDPQEDPEVAIGHDGQPRRVLSDVTSCFPPEQLPQQMPEEAIGKPEEAAGSFQLQRRGRQPRACRNLLSGDSDQAALPKGDHSTVASADTQTIAPLKLALRSSARQNANAVPASSSEASGSGGALNEGQLGICTRRQARLHKQSSQQSSQHSSQQSQLTQQDCSSDDDFAVMSQSQRQGKAGNHALATQSAASQGLSCNQGDAHTGASLHTYGVRRNRPRLQLNRRAKGVESAGADSQGVHPNASASTTAQL